MVKFVRVLVVDQDLWSLEDVANKLRELEYNVTTCSHAGEALALLGEEGHGFNIIISDAHMPNMDGLKLLEQKNVPVIIMSADEKSTEEVFMKAVEKGACHCLIKPVRSETLKYIWQHLVIMKRRLLYQKSKSNELGDINKGLKMSQSSDGGSDDSVPTVQKKRRVQWTDELQQNFLIVVDKLGGAFNAHPKRILDEMKVNWHWLTRENVASHLQKHRMHLDQEQKQNLARTYSSLQRINLHAHSIQNQEMQVTECTTNEGSIANTLETLPPVEVLSNPGLIFQNSLQHTLIQVQQEVSNANHTTMEVTANTPKTLPPVEVSLDPRLIFQNSSQHTSIQVQQQASNANHTTMEVVPRLIFQNSLQHTSIQVQQQASNANHTTMEVDPRLIFQNSSQHRSFQVQQQASNASHTTMEVDPRLIFQNSSQHKSIQEQQEASNPNQTILEVPPALPVGTFQETDPSSMGDFGGFLLNVVERKVNVFNGNHGEPFGGYQAFNGTQNHGFHGNFNYRDGYGFLSREDNQTRDVKYVPNMNHGHHSLIVEDVDGYVIVEDVDGYVRMFG